MLETQRQSDNPLIIDVGRFIVPCPVSLSGDSLFSFVWLFRQFYPISTKKFNSLHTVTILLTSQNNLLITFHHSLSLPLSSSLSLAFKSTFLYQVLYIFISFGHKKNSHILQKLKIYLLGFNRHMFLYNSAKEAYYKKNYSIFLKYFDI